MTEAVCYYYFIFKLVNQQCIKKYKKGHHLRSKKQSSWFKMTQKAMIGVYLLALLSKASNY